VEGFAGFELVMGDDCDFLIGDEFDEWIGGLVCGGYAACECVLVGDGEVTPKDMVRYFVPLALGCRSSPLVSCEDIVEDAKRYEILGKCMFLTQWSTLF